MKDILVVLGPTGIGKSDFSINYAQKHNAEIISADAFQVYKGMDIGTAKISKKEQELIPHHLIDILNPDQPYDVTQFITQTEKIIADLHTKNKQPILCGGTGLYIQAFLYGYQFPTVGEDTAFRNDLETQLATKGQDWLWQTLHTIDPVSASKIPPQNTRRVIRALEIHHLTQKKPSEVQIQQPTIRSDVHLMGLTSSRDIIIDRINRRVDLMFKKGLIEEVRHLINLYPKTCKAFEALGYKETIQYLEGHITLNEVKELIKIKTRQFAKRQMTWFKRLPNVTWIEPQI